MKHRRLLLCAAASTLSFIAGCAVNPQTGQPELAPSVQTQVKSIFDTSDPCSNRDRNIGILAGTLVATVLGHNAHHDTRRMALDATIGATLGGLLGHMMDQRRCALYKIAQRNHLKLASTSITPKKIDPHSSQDSVIGSDVQLQNSADEFEPGTAMLTPKARRYFAEIAQQYTPQTLLRSLGPNASPTKRNALLDRKVLIVGHTSESDATNPETAARLSEARARAVARVFAQQGVPARNIYYQGAGSTLPIASNATPRGQQENRRVQIVDVPNKSYLESYLKNRVPNAADFAVVANTPPESPTATSHANATGGEGAAPSPPPPIPAATKPNMTRHPGSAREPELTRSSSRERGHTRYASSGYDFGGQPVSGTSAPIDLGSPVNHTMFHIISVANAAEPVRVGSCLGDHPRIAGNVRNLATGQDLSTGQDLPVRDYMPGFYGAPWLGGFHGNLVTVDKAYIPRDSGSPVPKPKFMIYRHYRGNADAKPSYSARVPVNVYRGDKATLYRMFVDGPVECIDFVKPNTPGNAMARLYYRRDGHTYLAEGAFALKN